MRCQNRIHPSHSRRSSDRKHGPDARRLSRNQFSLSDHCHANGTDSFYPDCGGGQAVAVKQWRLSGGGQAVAELSDDHDRFLPTLESQSSFGRRRCILIDSTLILSLSAVAAFGNHLSDSHLYAVAVYATMDVPHEPLLPCIPHKG